MEFQEANRNYEEFLAAIGTGPCSQDMVMRAAVTLTIEQVAMVTGASRMTHGQEMDKQWRISSETVIKAKSVRGYRTANRKWTENKFKVREAWDTRYRCHQAGEGKPELVDDWDQRLVVTTLTAPENGRLVLQQVAEKDQVGKADWQQANLNIADAL